MPDLSENQYVARELMPATTREIADTMAISPSYVWDLVEGLRRKGVGIEQDSDGRYFVEGEPETSPPTTTARRRTTTGEKAATTRKAKKFLASLEHELNNKLEGTEPAVADGYGPTDGGTNLVLHRTDDHFGEETTNEDGDIVFDSEIAEARVNKVFDEALGIADTREAMGEEFDSADLIIGGDIVTGVTTFPDQAKEVDELLEDQINRATRVYTENIRRLADEFPHVQVVCTPGNHGEIRTGGGSVAANADNIVYSTLDRVVRTSDMDNVTFVRSDQAHYVNFSIRDYNAHVRHGHDRSLEHIGTSAGKQRWQNWLIDHDFDIAFRGHYHMLKEEPVNGVPVVMGGSIKPQSDHEEAMAIDGRPIAAVHGATDEYPLEWTERITFG